MMWLHEFSDLAVVPILPVVGSLLVFIIGGVLTLLAGLFTMRRETLRQVRAFLWTQKWGLLVLILLGFVLMQGVAAVWEWRRNNDVPPIAVTGEWRLFRGSLARAGWADSRPGPHGGGVQWTAERSTQCYSSPAIVGDYVLATISDGRDARIVSVDARSGERIWSAAPSGYRTTFSSPVVARARLVCGEGLHHTPNSRVVCFDLSQGFPRLAWEFATDSHVECTPVIDGDRVFVNAGDDGVYCLNLFGDGDQRIAWHLSGTDFPDAETALAVAHERVYVGLGRGGSALCVLDAGTGRELRRLPMPFSVFAPPAIDGDRLLIGMGNGNYLEQPTGAAGEVRCLDRHTLETLWSVSTSSPVLASVVIDREQVIFTCTDGALHCVQIDGAPVAQWTAPANVLAAPAVTDVMVYCISSDGVLTGLDRARLMPVWQTRLGAPGHYVSSPVIAHGHIYVGTPHDGLVCVGDPSTSADSDSTLGGNQIVPETKRIHLLCSAAKNRD